MLQCKNVGLTYPAGKETVDVLRRVNLTLPAFGLVLITGAPGSGKTALLRLLAGVEYPSRGTISVNGQSTARWNEQQTAAWRRRCGLASGELMLPDRSLAENAVLAAKAALGHESDARDNVEGMLKYLN